MKLKRLVVQGFKSFKDRQTIRFDEGVTGIVGPNGCGKSNIVDALFWVMGEQSARHLRGRTMKDLIFAGSAKYSRGAFAEVVLVLENEEGKHIHIGREIAVPSEIQLSRKLYRNGETEYRINGRPCRLRDIQEVFMDTGAGAKSYSIIAQGEVDRLVQAKPLERRSMVEEVAGITKFKMRKQESARKIEVTRQNLDRLRDLRMEIGKTLQSLSRQAERARKATRLKEKVRRYELSSMAHKVFEQLRLIREHRLAADGKGAEIEELRARADRLEVSLEEERVRRDEWVAGIEERRREHGELSRALAAGEEKLRSAGEARRRKEEDLAVREREIGEIVKELEDRRSLHGRLLAERERMEGDGPGPGCGELEEAVSSLGDELESVMARHLESSRKLSADREELAEVEAALARNASGREELSRALQDLAREVEALEGRQAGSERALAEGRREAEGLGSAAEGLEGELAGLRDAAREAALGIGRAEKALRSKTKESVLAESRLLSLRDRASLEGPEAGAGMFLEEVGGGPHALLGDLVGTGERYVKGVQALLRDSLAALVGPPGEGGAPLRWLEGLEGPRPGLGVFLPSGAAGRARPPGGIPGAVPLNDVVEIPAGSAALLRPFLEGFFLAPELDWGMVEGGGPWEGVKGVATFDGTRVLRIPGGGGVYEAAAPSPGGGVIERGREAAGLEERLADLSGEVAEAEAGLASAEAELGRLREEEARVLERLTGTRSERETRAVSLDSLERERALGEERLEVLGKRKEEVSRERLAAMEEEEELRGRGESLAGAVGEGRRAVDESGREVERLRGLHSAEKERLLERRVMAKSFEDRHRALFSQLDDVGGQVARQEARLESHRGHVAKLRSEIRELEEGAESLSASNREAAAVLEEREGLLDSAREDLSRLARGMREREDQAKKVAGEIAKAEKVRVERRTRLERHVEEEERLVRDAFERHRVDLREAVCGHLEYGDEDRAALADLSGMRWMETADGQKELEAAPYEFSRRYGSALAELGAKLRRARADLSSLGEVNWQAVEDHDRQKRRHDFLEEQERELGRSLENLDEAVARIDAKSRERFREAFAEVDERFRKVFPIIFGGGEARLQAVGEIDDPECGVEIVARPPGKKMQNIGLMSGGKRPSPPWA